MTDIHIADYDARNNPLLSNQIVDFIDEKALLKGKARTINERNNLKKERAERVCPLCKKINCEEHQIVHGIPDDYGRKLPFAILSQKDGQKLRKMIRNGQQD